MADSSIFVGFDHVQLAMPRGQEAVARVFWSDLLGFVEIPKPAALSARGGAWFGFPGGHVHVGGEEPFTAARKAHPAFRLRSPDACRALHARLAAAGVAVRWAAEDPAVVRFHADDPFGNRLEFTCPA